MNPLPSVTPPITPGATTNLGSSGLAGNSHGVSVSRPSMAAIGAAKVGNYFGSAAGSSLLGALGSGVMNLVSGGINRHWQKKDYERQRQDALADYRMQRQDYLSDLADERAYNSPVAQRARLLQAGINPNTVFGNGSVSNTSSPASNNSQLRGSDMSSPGRLGSLGSEMVDAIMPTMSVSLSDLQAENLREDIALKKANAIRLLSDAKGIDARTKGQLIQNGWYDALNASTIAERTASANKYIDDLRTNAVNRLFTQYQIDHMLPAQKANLQASTSKLFSEVQSIVQQMEFFDSVKNVRQRQEIMQMKRDSLALAMDKFEYDLKDNMPQYNVNGYHNVMREINFFIDSILGFWAGSSPLKDINFHKKPSKIGFK